MRKPTLRPAKSSMPQTTIYVSPRSLGAFDERPPAVVTTDLARLFAGSPALAGVSLRMRAGGCVALLGPNGAGKTTLLRLLATAIRPSYGSAEVDGLDVGRDADLVRERVAYLSHATALYDDLTARENLDFAATMLGTPDPADRVARARSPTSASPPVPATASERSRPACAAGWRSAGSCSGRRRSCCWTSRPPRSTRRASSSSRRCLRRGATAGVSVLVASHSVDRLERWVDARVALDRGLVAEVSGDGVTWMPPAPSPEPRTGGGSPMSAAAPGSRWPSRARTRWPSCAAATRR